MEPEEYTMKIWERERDVLIDLRGRLVRKWQSNPLGPSSKVKQGERAMALGVVDEQIAEHSKRMHQFLTKCNG
jgi:hypothetical protein